MGQRRTESNQGRVLPICGCSNDPMEILELRARTNCTVPQSGAKLPISGRGKAPQDLPKSQYFRRALTYWNTGYSVFQVDKHFPHLNISQFVNYWPIRDCMKQILKSTADKQRRVENDLVTTRRATLRRRNRGTESPRRHRQQSESSSSLTELESEEST